MAVFNAAKREIDLKIVYYGPAMCGKTTNVQCIHKMLAPQQRGELMSLATKDDRTLFFDFLPIELGDVRGFKTRFHIYTVPGQVYYGLTRRAVLTGADGVVFVADSQANKMQDNIESLKDLADNLKFYKKDITSFPFVLQYNKRDLPHVSSVGELNAMLNSYNVPAYESSALTGMGVVETLTGICKLVLKQMDSGTAKKKPAQPAATVSGGAKDAAAAAQPSAVPAAATAEDTGLKIFSEAPPAPSFAQKPEPVQPEQIPLAAPQPPLQKPSLRLSPVDPSAPSLEISPAPQYEGMLEKPSATYEEQPSDISADAGLSFDDEEAVVLEEPTMQEQELSFDDEDALVLEEPTMQEPELSFDDEDALVLEEPTMQEPELSFDDEEAVVLEEPELQEPELSFDDEEAVVLEEPELQEPELSFDDEEAVILEEPGLQEPELSFDNEEAVVLEEPTMQEPELAFDDETALLTEEEPALGLEETEISFEDDVLAPAAEPAPGASAPTVFDDASAGLTLEEPSLQFEEPSAGMGFPPMPSQTPELSGFTIVTCGQPRKISDTSISLPMTIRLNKNDAECPVTITISLGDMAIK
jgi:hypothetical protein